MTARTLSVPRDSSTVTSEGTITVRGWLDERAVLFAERDMLVDESRTWTYAEGVRLVRACAGVLHRAGVSPGDHVAIHCRTNIDYVVVFLAVLGLGAVAVHSNVLYSLDETRHVLEHGEAGFVLAEKIYLEDSRFDAQVRTDGRVVLDIADVIEQAWLRPRGWPEVDAGTPSSDASILFTSGSTGRPKGAVYVQASYPWAGEVIGSAFRLTSRDRVLCCVPFFHMNGQMCHMAPTLHAGAALCVVDRFSASAFWNQVRRFEATFSSLPATAIRILLATETALDDGDNPLERVLLGLSLTPEQHDAFEKRFRVRLQECYGLTEGVCITTVNPMGARARYRSGGLPSLGYAIRIVDDKGQPRGVGEVGHIEIACVARAGLLTRYHRDPAATAAVFRNGWLRTGDLGKIDDDGYFYFFARDKDLIKRSGHNVAAAEVERVLQEHPGVREVAVVGIPDELRDEAVKAFVVLQPDSVPTHDELAAFCRERLAEFKVPTVFEVRDELPRTAGGKILKAVLRLEPR